MCARAPTRDDEGGDPPKGLADDSTRGCGAVPRRVRPRSQLRRRRASGAPPARDGRVASRARREDQPRRPAARRTAAGTRRGQDHLYGGAAAPDGEVLHRDRSAASRQEGDAGREHRGGMSVRTCRLAARDAARRPRGVRLGRGRARRSAARQGRRLLRSRVRPPARGRQGPRVDADSHDGPSGADRGGAGHDAAARRAGRLPRDPERGHRHAPGAPTATWHLLGPAPAAQDQRHPAAAQASEARQHRLALAAEQIAHAICRRRAKVTVFVPHYAMSGGTLIALAADEIVMDPNAVLGSLDPQLGNHPAASIVRAVAWKTEHEQKIDDETLILEDIARKAMFQLRECVAAVLSDRFGPEKAAALADTFTQGQWTHDHPLNVETLTQLGLPINTDMPREIYDYMRLFPQASTGRPSVQYIPVPYRRSVPVPSPQSKRAGG